MAYNREKPAQEVNAGSMADIAFLLLIFFLVTTQIVTNKGILMPLPPKTPPAEVKIPERNLFKIQINSGDKLLVEGELLEDLDRLDEMVYDFVLNFGAPDAIKRGRSGVSDQQTFNALPASMKDYIEANLKHPGSSDGPSEAIVSLKTDRGTSYKVYIAVLDQVNAAYYRIYGERLGISAEEYRKLSRYDPAERYRYEQGRRGINKAISLAEPTKAGG